MIIKNNLHLNLYYKYVYKEVINLSSFKNQEKLKAVTFSYDDGTTQDIRLIELLNKYNLKSTFNLNSELLGQKGILIRNNQRIAHYKIFPEDVRHIYSGHEVAVHTLTHPRLTELDEKEIIRQVSKDRENLSELVGYDVCGMAYPCGGVNNDDRVAEIIKNNTEIRYCRTITNTDSFDPQPNLYRFNPNVCHVVEYDRMMEMGKQFVDLKCATQKIFYIWGHSYELDYCADYWIKLEEFFEFISNN